MEASLDIQYTMGVAPGVPGVFWYTAGRQPGSTDNEPFLVFLQDLASTAAAPWVISTSYGDDEPTVAYDYAQRVNVEFQKAGVRGISILFSSGDGGVSGGQSQQCTTYVPTYPAGSPFVTAVGGTTSTNPEVGVSFSSGGFANYAARPAYQNSAVYDYVKKYAGATLPAQNLWNASGRGFPDVSAQGTSYPVVVGGTNTSRGGRQHWSGSARTLSDQGSHNQLTHSSFVFHLISHSFFPFSFSLLPAPVAALSFRVLIRLDDPR